ncbi:MAG: GFA family protein, partial [Polyangiaceae bacterium]
TACDGNLHVKALSLPSMLTVQCLCGAVTLSIEGLPVAQFFCHCDHCQRVHGAAYVPVSMYRTDQVKVVSGEPSVWKLHATPRASCRECSTRLFAEPVGIGMRTVMALLLPKESFTPQFHMQCAHAIAPVKDGLPHFKGFPESFGGSSAVVDW